MSYIALLICKCVDVALQKTPCHPYEFANLEKTYQTTPYYEIMSDVRKNLSIGIMPAWP
jgi:hypothetical protein